jgi:hypothetical protein
MAAAKEAECWVVVVRKPESGICKGFVFQFAINGGVFYEYKDANGTTLSGDLSKSGLGLLSSDISAEIVFQSKGMPSVRFSLPPSKGVVDPPLPKGSLMPTSDK